MGVFFRPLWLYFALIISAILCLFQLVFLKVPLVPKIEEAATTTNIYDHRELMWMFVPTADVVRGQGWYDNYDDGTVAQYWGDKSGDAPDYLRPTDVCYDNGSYSRSSCPSPPNCNFHGKWGKAKLCINRAPAPDETFFYVLVMKCIPHWENCDKCICGKITSERKNGYCKYTAGIYGDDWVHMNCQSPGAVSVKNFYFNPPNRDKRNRRRKRNGLSS